METKNKQTKKNFISSPIELKGENKKKQLYDLQVDRFLT